MNWPLVLAASTGLYRDLRQRFPGEIVPPLNESVKRSEFPFNQGLRLDLQLGDRVLVPCFLKGESLD